MLGSRIATRRWKSISDGWRKNCYGWKDAYEKMSALTDSILVGSCKIISNFRKKLLDAGVKQEDIDSIGMNGVMDAVEKEQGRN